MIAQERLELVFSRTVQYFLPDCLGRQHLLSQEKRKLGCYFVLAGKEEALEAPRAHAHWLHRLEDLLHFVLGQLLSDQRSRNTRCRCGHAA